MTYSNSLAVSRQTYIRRNQNILARDVQMRSLGPVSTTIAIIALSCVLFLLYLTQVTKTSTYSYRLNELSTKQSQLKQEYAELEVESARLQALDRAKNSQPAKNLTAVIPAGYVQN